ncbi:hypothetical protein N7486_007436 [Penicillium sp. IBT 16267x]|nr:hypothetical protein N7486_007436 [Penicillium sp. IBT 16267x]
MSNFMHKVKDAMTDRDKDTDRGYNDPNQDTHGSQNAPMHPSDTKTHNNPSGGSNPFGSTRSGDQSSRHPRFNEPQNVGEPTNTETGNQYGAGQGSDPYAQTRAGGGATNVGPHDSAVANKLDPRVDSDMDNRASQARTEGERPNVAHAQGFNPSNTSSLRQQQQQQPQPQQFQQQQQPGMQSGMQGFDNHKSSEDKYSKEQQEHSSHSQPFGDQMTSEDDYRSSTQENKSHSTTSHTAPCDTNVGAGAGGMGGNAQKLGGNVGAGGDNFGDTGAEAGGMGGNAQKLGGNVGAGGSGFGDTGVETGGMGGTQPGFGGNAAAGGSSYGDNTGTGGRSGAQAQNTDPMNKLDPRVNRANEQQNVAGNQRGGY